MLATARPLTRPPCCGAITGLLHRATGFSSPFVHRHLSTTVGHNDDQTKAAIDKAGNQTGNTVDASQDSSQRYCSQTDLEKIREHRKLHGSNWLRFSLAMGRARSAESSSSSSRGADWEEGRPEGWIWSKLSQAGLLRKDWSQGEIEDLKRLHEINENLPARIVQDMGRSTGRKVRRSRPPTESDDAPNAPKFNPDWSMAELRRMAEFVGSQHPHERNGFGDDEASGPEFPGRGVAERRAMYDWVVKDFVPLGAKKASRRKERPLYSFVGQHGFDPKRLNNVRTLSGIPLRVMEAQKLRIMRAEYPDLYRVWKRTSGRTEKSLELFPWADWQFFSKL